VGWAVDVLMMCDPKVMCSGSGRRVGLLAVLTVATVFHALIHAQIGCLML
jgi:hypothetical protein